MKKSIPKNIGKLQTMLKVVIRFPGPIPNRSENGLCALVIQICLSILTHIF